MASLGKPRPYTGKNEKAGKHLGPSGLKSQVPVYERFELKGTPKVVWFSLPACSFKAQGQNNSYQKFMQYFPASTATWSINIQPFPWVDSSVTHATSLYFHVCLIKPGLGALPSDTTTLSSDSHPALWHACSALPCDTFQVMKQQKRSLPDVVQMPGPYTWNFLAYQKPNKRLCFINYPVFRITAFKRKEGEEDDTVGQHD